MKSRITFPLLFLSILVFIAGGLWWYFSMSSERKIQIDASVATAPLAAGDDTVEVHTTETPAASPTNETPSTSDTQVTAQPEVTTKATPHNTTDTSTPSAVSTTSTTSTSDITDALVSFGYSAGKASRVVDTIVVHSSYNAIGGDPYDVKQIIQEYREAGVAPHYLVARDGSAYRLVREVDVAYHAGVSEMPDGRKNVNDFSIGIEMVGTTDSGYADAQYAALSALIKDIKTRHTIKYVVGHSDIAPGRKTDPWRLDWSRVKR